MQVKLGKAIEAIRSMRDEWISIVAGVGAAVVMYYGG